VWLPADADTDPVSAVLEAAPYRPSDGMAARDARIHPCWAKRGCVCARVDVRGSGESDGVLEDEYHPQKQDDLLDVSAWIAARQWCSGAVGMTGIPWGGFNRLELLVRPHRPEDISLRPFDPPVMPGGFGERTIGGGRGGRSCTRDLVDDDICWPLATAAAATCSPPTAGRARSATG
jgi:hypothetical protein